MPHRVTYLLTRHVTHACVVCDYVNYSHVQLTFDERRSPIPITITATGARLDITRSVLFIQTCILSVILFSPFLPSYHPFPTPSLTLFPIFFSYTSCGSTFP